MTNLQFSHKDFIEGNSADYILSICQTADGLSFSIHDENGVLLGLFSKKLLTYKEILLEYKTNKYLNKGYKKVFFAYCNKEKLLIPKEIYDANISQELLKVSVKQKDKYYRSSEISKMQAYVVEFIPLLFDNIISIINTNNKIYSTNIIVPFINRILTKDSGSAIYIDIHPSYFDLVINIQGKIIFYNSYDYETPTDIVYYAIYAIKTRDVSSSEIPIILSGGELCDIIYNILNKTKEIFSIYYYDVVISQDESLELLDKNIESAKFLNLINLRLCE